MGGGLALQALGGLGATSPMAAPWNTLSSLPAIRLNLSSPGTRQDEWKQHPEIACCPFWLASPYLYFLHPRAFCAQNVPWGWPGCSLQKPAITEFWEKKTGPRVLYSHQSLFSRYLRQQTEFLSLSFILVSSVCCDRIQTGWLVNNETIFSRCWRLEVQIEVQHSGVLGRGLSPVHTGCLLTLSSHTGRGRGRFLGSHLWGHWCHSRGPHPHRLPKAHPHTPPHWEWDFNGWIWGQHKHSAISSSMYLPQENYL